jgi:hypothetical protein
MSDTKIHLYPKFGLSKQFSKEYINLLLESVDIDVDYCLESIEFIQLSQDDDNRIMEIVLSFKSLESKIS